MRIVRIFVDENLNGLHSIRFAEQDLSEFRRLLLLWNDTEYVTNYCADNQSYLNTEYFRKHSLSIDAIIAKILKEAQYLYSALKEITNESFEKGSEKLQSFFKPLDNYQINVPVLQETKFRYEDGKNFPDSILRIYALRVSENMFIVTGGAIKLVHQMKDHKDTQLELDKLQEVARFLGANDITDTDSLIEYYESI